MSGSRAAAALRPLEAFDALARFARRRGDVSLRLAMHAAVPQSFRPELLHLLKLNFVPEAVDDTAAEADVLLAPFTDDLGGGYFQFDPEIRRLLLDYLGDTYAAEPVLRARRVADFLLRYVGRAERHVFAVHDRLGREFLETQRWVGLAFARPEEAAEQLAGALQAAEEMPELGARLHLGGLAQAVAIPLAHHRDLLNYARGLQLLATGETDAGEALLEPLLDREITVGRVTLQPRRVVSEAPPADEAPAPPEETAAPGAERVYRVFISGTLLDLKEYREAAAAVCEQLGLMPVRWETLPATTESPHSPAFWDSQRIDLLLCLVGKRYGYVPSGQEWSGTETELNHARSRDIDVLPFFVDAGDPPSNGENRERLQAFRTRIVDAFAVQVADSPEEFRERLQRQLTTWIHRRQERSQRPHSADEAKRTESETPGLIRSLFLSYDPSEWHFARQLQRDLANAGFEIRMDVIHVPGTALLPALQRAIDTSDSFLCVVTQHRAQKVLYSEWQFALDRGKHVIPLMRAGDRSRDLPQKLQSLQSIDFRQERPYEQALSELLHALRQAPAPRLGELYRVPSMPSMLVERDEILEEVKKSVFESGSQATILEGPAGIGKTTLAIALAHDEGVRRRFSDGVLWFPDQGDFRDQQAAFLNTHTDALSEAEAGWPATSASIAMGMRRVLADGAYLVILDDVQDGTAVESLAGAGPQTHVLATARDAHVWRGLSAEVISVLPFTGEEALRFLALRSGVPLDDLPPETREIADFTEFHPLTLELIARQLRAGTSWSAAVDTLRDASNTWSRDERLLMIRRLDMLPPWERRLLASLTL
ncbi:MAG TPA: TIR domain-containing protein [Longimicrobium sp.]|jgi:hypothetical protein|uniref:TIR domain-containing protein n=1 Tax=Longimicrobium sp. TaxID=2029185 RepID=UPI002EDABA65